ncbi:MAG: hypothetical protein RLZZ387_1791 [Chloroflexota bacterium]|jgi:FSR family fosmidomycin resistance protein-like MFS transporter
MRQLRAPLILGLSHGLSDGAAGFLLGGLSRAMPLADVALLVLLYNALAFGGQPLAGFLVDRARQPRAAALAGLLLIGAALALAGAPRGESVSGSSDTGLRAAVALAGVGGALFHVGGGALALAASGGRAAGPGLFAAPGVVGLALGGMLAASGSAAWWAFLPPLALLALAVARLPSALSTWPSALSTQYSALSTQHFDPHDLVMVVLLAAIALRSLIWSTVDFLFQGRYEALLALALAAALGKLLGGPLADQVGWRRYTVGALALAAPLLALAGDSLTLLIPGVALLQSATPAALAALSRQMPHSPATATGLALGLAVAVGGLPGAAGAAGALAAPAALAGLCLAAALAMWLALTRSRPHPTSHSG